MNGAEEDGVDNRVEAPARVAGDGSDGTPPGENAKSDLTPASPADTTAPEVTQSAEVASSSAPTSDTERSVSPGAAADRPVPPPTAATTQNDGGWPEASGPWPGGNPAWQSDDSWRSASAETSSPSWQADGSFSPAWQSGEDTSASHDPAPGAPARPAYGHTGTQPIPSLMAPPPEGATTGPQVSAAAIQASAAAAVAGAASSARGLAAKVSSSFSGLTKPKPKPPKARPSKGVPMPSSAGRQSSAQGAAMPPPRPQQAQSFRQHSARAPQPPQARRAMLTLERIEPISVMKFSFLISLVGWVVLFVAVAVIYFSLSKLGVFAKIEHTVGLVTYNKTHPGTNAASWFRASRVLEYTALVCTINAILFTALATVGAALYNLITNLTGGIEVTLKESD
jgi:Transmembrane domain of unknown function (DUF3566)